MPQRKCTAPNCESGKKLCEVCHGTQKYQDKLCYRCSGARYVGPCPTCKGTGYVD
jgi:hypothetical protein